MYRFCATGPLYQRVRKFAVITSLPRTGASVAHRRHLAERINTRMRELDINQFEIARRMNTNRDNVSGWARGMTFPRPEALEKLAKVLGVNIEYLVPPVLMNEAAKDKPAEACSVTMMSDGMAHIHIDAIVPAELAGTIITMMGKRSGSS